MLTASRFKMSVSRCLMHVSVSRGLFQVCDFTLNISRDHGACFMLFVSRRLFHVVCFTLSVSRCSRRLFLVVCLTLPVSRVYVTLSLSRCPSQRCNGRQFIFDFKLKE